jgi:hypothetical protein
VLPDLWHHIVDLTARQTAPPALLVVLTAAAALVATLYRPLWRWLRNAVTIAHEGGHALVAVLVGRRLQSIRLHSDTSGLTVSKGKPHGFGMVVTLMVGYAAPSLLGLGGAWLLSGQRIRLTLWITVVLLVPMLFMIRNLYGVLAMLISGGIVFAVSWYASPQVQAGFAYTGVWFLLVGGVRPVFELAGQRRRRQISGSDVDQLAALTHIPGGAWLFLYTVVCAGALALGTILLGLRGAVAALTG